MTHKESLPPPRRGGAERAISSRRPTHRLNLYLVPSDPERRVDEAALDAGLRRIISAGIFAADGAPGEGAARLVSGGFVAWRIDRPPSPTVYGNRQGGYAARCPACGGGLARELAAALGRWRAGEGTALVCPACGTSTHIAALSYAPAAAPARYAVELRDVGAPELLTADIPGFNELFGGAPIGIPSRG
ncbi:zinc ribbon domain-containing protein [Myxococcota bacterium]|nr:zinc ribbon domain-containing protein [Myxococcota bacterium]